MLIVAEAFGALAVILNFIGYRQNNVDRYLLISAFALAALSAHFFMLDAMAAVLARYSRVCEILLRLNTVATAYCFYLSGLM
ncbi:YgjV family protein [Alteromonas sp. 009811495]|nr:YgjV family protein [Alteromonas sp. 009811495]WDT85516.1 YgjV family protein [Alteromonas sp. 009811495]